MFLRKTALMLAGIISISASAAEVDFNRDVRPILTSNCYQCHGPDDKTRKAKLRLDRENSTREILEDMVEFITSRDPEQIMPPPESGKQLTPGLNYWPIQHEPLDHVAECELPIAC